MDCNGHVVEYSMKNGSLLDTNPSLCGTGPFSHHVRIQRVRVRVKVKVKVRVRVTVVQKWTTPSLCHKLILFLIILNYGFLSVNSPELIVVGLVG